VTSMSPSVVGFQPQQDLARGYAVGLVGGHSAKVKGLG
jgi:hypothetical protein